METRESFCGHCGGVLTRWRDVAAALRSFIPNAPIGYKPLFLQAAQEIERYRAVLERMSQNEGVINDYPYWAREALHPEHPNRDYK